MTKNKSATTLRQRAEEIVQSGSAKDTAALSPDEIRDLVHEMQVHQIELELQNEELRLAQRQLDASRKQDFELFDLAPVGYCILSDKGIILEADLTLSVSLDVARGDLVKQPISRFIFNEDQPIFYLHHKELFESGVKQVIEFRMIRANQSLFWARVEASATQDASGIAMCRVVISDITERKQAAESMRASDERFRILASLLPVGIYLTTPQGQCQYANPHWCEMAELSLEEALGSGWVKGLHPDDRASVFSAWRQMVDSEGRWGMEYRFQTPGGKVTWVYGLAVPQRDSLQKIVGYVGVNIDITERKRADEESRKSYEQITNILESISDAFFSLDDEMTVTYFNKAAESMLGRCSSDVIGRNLFGAFPEARGSVFEERYRQAIREKRALNFETCFEVEPYRNWYDVRIFPQEKGISVFFQVTTERKLAEAALRRNESKHCKMIANIGDVLVIIDQNGITQYKSPNITKYFGWRPEEVVGVSALELVHPEDLNLAKSFIGSLMAKPNVPDTTECRYLCKDESCKWIEFTGVNLVHDPEIAGILGNYHDITDRKRAEELLRESERRLTLASRSAKLGIWDWDIIKNRMTWDDQMFQLYGITEKPQNYGVEIWEQGLHPEDRDQALAACQSALRGERDYDIEFRVKHPDGSVHHIKANGTVLRSQDGQPIRMLGINYDITQQKDTEGQLRQAQKLESIGQLAGGVAHDFNNILASIMIQLSLLQRNPSLDPDTKESLKELMSEAQRAANLTRQLLMFSRRSVLAIKTLDLNEVVGNLLRMLERLIGEHIHMVFARRSGLPQVEADPGMIEQVILNLCVNAKDAMSKGGKLTIGLDAVRTTEDQTRIYPGVQPGLFVCLSVTDTGCGMDEATLKRIFEPFFTTKEVGKGTGLGLATVHGIVAQHKGWMDVESELGKGTTFKVFLPATTKVMAEPTKTEKKGVIRGHEAILIVEDESGLRRLVAQGLRQIGYRVFEANSGQTAMKLWPEHSQYIDLLFSDMVMPDGMTGKELAEKLKEAKSNLKIIISSGYNLEMVRQGQPTADGIFFLQKPYDFDVLTQTIRDCLDSA